MPRRRFRDVITGLFTSAADAKSRPANTVAETVRNDSPELLHAKLAANFINGAIPAVARREGVTTLTLINALEAGDMTVEHFDRLLLDAAHIGEIDLQSTRTFLGAYDMTDAEVDQHDLDVAGKVAGTDAAAADRLLDTIGAPEAYTEEMAALTAESESTRFRDGGDVGPVEYIDTNVTEVVGLSVEIVVRDGDGRSVNWISTLDEPTRVSKGQMPAFALMLKQAIKGGNVMVGATYEEVRDAKQADALRYYERARLAYINYYDDLVLSSDSELTQTYTDDGVEIVMDAKLCGLYGPTPPPLKMVYRKRGARDFVSRAEARANPAAHVALVVLARN